MQGNGSWADRKKRQLENTAGEKETGHKRKHDQVSQTTISLVDDSDSDVDRKISQNHKKARVNSATSVQEGSDELERVTQLKLLTYNIWFDDFSMKRRMKYIKQIVLEEKADIIAFQECTDASLAMLQQQKWVQNDYWMSPEPVDHAGYFTLLFGHKKRTRTLGFKRVPMRNSRMGRTILITCIEVLGATNKQRISIATSHLESGPKEVDTREAQFQACLRVLGPSKQQTTEAVFMGDMNMRKPEGKSPPDGVWKDCWLELGNEHKDGYTYDMKMNTMITKWGKYDTRQRYDRIYARLTQCTLGTMKRVGMQSMYMKDDRHVFPSDHFGLVMTLNV